MSSAETPRFDATAAAQQMLDLDQPDPHSQRCPPRPTLPPSHTNAVLGAAGPTARNAHRPRQRQAVREALP